MLEPYDRTGRVRMVIRYGVVVLAGIVAGSRAVSAYAARVLLDTDPDLSA